MESVVLELIRMVDWQYRELFTADNINGIGEGVSPYRFVGFNITAYGFGI
ncbi:hypothetical protein P5G60_19130 [Paenibacillus jamilae]|nr:hypothetical protein [Paenibacillus jamilae]